MKSPRAWLREFKNLHLERFAVWVFDVVRLAGAGNALSSTVIVALAVLAFQMSVPGTQGPAVDAIAATATLVTVFLLGFLGSAWALATLSPSDYANHRVSGKSVSVALTILAWESLGVVRQFTRSARELHRWEGDRKEAKLVTIFARERDNREAGADADASNELRLAITKYKRGKRNLHVRLQRIEEMIKRTADDFDIPITRLSDHVLAYSPAMHQWFVDRYNENWHAILASVESRSGGTQRMERLLSLVRDNRGIWRNAQYRIDALTRLVRFKAFHGDIRGFASEHSTSGSIVRYSHTVQRASAYVGQLLRDWDGNPRSGSLQEAGDLIAFIVAKQRAYPGFDLNVASARVCMDAAMSLGDASQRDLARHFGEALQGFGRLRGESGSMLLDPFKEHADPERELKSRFRLLAGSTDQEGVRSPGVYELVDDQIRRERRGVIKNFRTVLERWLLASRCGDRLIVTHGFSNTVRDALHSNLGKLLNEGDAIPPVIVVGTALQRLEGHRSRLYDAKKMINAVRFGGHQAEHEETKLGGSEWRVYPTMPSADAGADGARSKWGRRKISNVSYCNIESLQGLLRDRSNVLIILGAECFDGDRRVVHPRGMQDDLHRFVQSVHSRRDAARVLVVVVAERYKYQPNGLFSVQDSFSEHWDRIDIYQSDVINIIVTDAPPEPSARCDAEGVFPADWRDQFFGE